MKKVGEATPALIVAALGVALAWLHFTWLAWAPFVFLVVGLVVGLAGSSLGRGLLPNHPVGAVRLMEFSILVPYMLAALASGLAIILAVEFAPQEGWSDEQKQLVAAAAGAITAFLTAGFIKSVEEADANYVADPVKEAFQAAYKRKENGKQEEPNVKYFPAGSAGERWVHSGSFGGIDGWDHDARIKRARGVKQALRNQ